MSRGANVIRVVIAPAKNAAATGQCQLKGLSAGQYLHRQGLG